LYTKKAARAKDTLEFLKQYCKKIDFFENDALIQDNKLSIKESFELLNEKIHQLVCLKKS